MPLSSSASGSRNDPNTTAGGRTQPDVYQRQAGYGGVGKTFGRNVSIASKCGRACGRLGKNELSGVRIAVNQDLVIPWVPFDRCRAVYDDELGALDPGYTRRAHHFRRAGLPWSDHLPPGDHSASLTRPRCFRASWTVYTDPEIQKLRIKISGCPIPCGHASHCRYRFYGNVRKVGEQASALLPAFARRKVNADGVHLGGRSLLVPARPIPAIIRDCWRSIRRTGNEPKLFRVGCRARPDQGV